MISSKDNPQIKYAARLLNRKYRDTEGKFLVEGVKLVSEVLLRPDMVEQVFVCDADLMAKVDPEQEFSGMMIEIDAKLGKLLSDTETPQGIWAVCHKPVWPELLNELCPEVILLLTGLQDPGNMGTILRTAAAFGIGAVLLSEGTVDPFAPKVFRASAGAVIDLPVFGDVTERDLLRFIKEGYRVLACEAHNGANLSDADMLGKTIIVVGNEGQGVAPQFAEHVDQSIKIPLQSGVESLNAAVACGIILYESYQQRINPRVK
ncbi:MAG: TrmH family RNA methyltransferase [Acidobacteriota bacterium]